MRRRRLCAATGATLPVLPFAAWAQPQSPLLKATAVIE